MAEINRILHASIIYDNIYSACVVEIKTEKYFEETGFRSIKIT